MSRIRIAAALFALGLATPALANDNEKSFTHDGVTYTYTATRTEDALVLEGVAEPLGGKFRLVVRDGKVTGYAGSARVSFLVADAMKDRTLARLASLTR